MVDWNTAIIASGASRKRRGGLVSQLALEHIERVVSDFLAGLPEGFPFRVRLRLYAGWWAGKTPTDYRRGVEDLLGKYASRPRTHHGRIFFQAGTEGLQLGDRLAEVRTFVTRRQRVHFLDMVRFDKGMKREKMVDTALIADLVGLAKRRRADRYIVVSDDDDMLPGIISAHDLDAQVRMISRAGSSSKYMSHLKSLIHAY